MSKLLPFARRKCFLESSLGISRGLFGNATVAACRKGLSTRNDETGESRPVLSKVSGGGGGEVTTFTKVKETTKTASYVGVIIAGLGVTAVIFYTVLKELFSAKSPNNIYSEALERCRNDPSVQNALGAPIKGFGEETSRRRRRHVSHVVYNKDGVNRLRMKFYIEGFRKKATVHLEMQEDENGNYVYRYLFVETDDFGRPPIVLEDNRYGLAEPPKGKRIEEDPTFVKQLEIA